MSGIAGIVYRDKKPVAQTILQEMAHPLASHRGKDGVSFWIEKQVGFVHLMTHDTPESLNERLPYQTADGRLAITFHGRLDNREDIYSQCELKEPITNLADSRLIIAAYQEWGESCPERLLGDFAFAIWDQSAQKLFCARDHMGVKPLFFCLTPSFFCFATEIKSILALPGISKEINEERLADFLVCVVTENRTSFFKDIFRLQPAHTLVFQDNTLKENRYWQMKPAEFTFKTDQEYEEAFLDIFTKAVHARLRSAFPVGAFLSGGLDSSSITCMAAGPLNSSFQGNLHTFSGIFDTITECDEREFFQSVLDRYPTTPHFLETDQLLPGQAFDQFAEYADEPIYGPHFFMGWGLLAQAQKAGVRVLLDGHDGDSAVSYGYGRLAELAGQGRIFQLAREYQGIKSLNPYRAVRRILALYRLLLRKKRPFPNNVSSGNAALKQNLEMCNPEFLLKSGVEERLLQLLEKMPDRSLPEAELHYLNINQPLHPYALEFLEKTSAYYGISQCFPFFDIRVIQFCLALPAEQKLRLGYNRDIVRRALQNILPNSTRYRKEKTDFSQNLLDGFHVRDRDWFLSSIDNAAKRNYDHVNINYIIGNEKEPLSPNSTLSTTELLRLLKLIAVDKWMQKISTQDK
ncbi:MAG: asparagine synthase-related protein [Desulfobulbaceae bacterium]|jgi:asparagine synthase (glutamine-hydrolysing)|nr:asparagine synthase-related protein [Desulfobulbaceae bacterium]